MRIPLSIACALSFTIAVTGCATIAGGGPRQPVTLQSTPQPASFTIHSSSGLQMGQGTTPGTVSLPRKNEYQIDISMPGYETQSAVLTKGVNGWIWGNLLFGWIVGFIVDFASGSAYKLEPALVQVTLERADEETYAVIHLLDDRGREISSRRLLMVPSAPALR